MNVPSKAIEFKVRVPRSNKTLSKKSTCLGTHSEHEQGCAAATPVPYNNLDNKVVITSNGIEADQKIEQMSQGMTNNSSQPVLFTIVPANTTDTKRPTIGQKQQKITIQRVPSNISGDDSVQKRALEKNTQVVIPKKVGRGRPRKTGVTASRPQSISKPQARGRPKTSHKSKLLQDFVLENGKLAESETIGNGMTQKHHSKSASTIKAASNEKPWSREWLQAQQTTLLLHLGKMAGVQTPNVNGLSKGATKKGGQAPVVSSKRIGFRTEKHVLTGPNRKPASNSISSDTMHTSTTALFIPPKGQDKQSKQLPKIRTNKVQDSSPVLCVPPPCITPMCTPTGKHQSTSPKPYGTSVAKIHNEESVVVPTLLTQTVSPYVDQLVNELSRQLVDNQEVRSVNQEHDVQQLLLGAMSTITSGSKCPLIESAIILFISALKQRFVDLVLVSPDVSKCFSNNYARPPAKAAMKTAQLFRSDLLLQLQEQSTDEGPVCKADQFKTSFAVGYVAGKVVSGRQSAGRPPAMDGLPELDKFNASSFVHQTKEISKTLAMFKHVKFDDVQRVEGQCEQLMYELGHQVAYILGLFMLSELGNISQVARIAQMDHQVLNEQVLQFISNQQQMFAHYLTLAMLSCSVNIVGVPVSQVVCGLTRDILWPLLLVRHRKSVSQNSKWTPTFNDMVSFRYQASQLAVVLYNQYMTTVHAMPLQFIVTQLASHQQGSRKQTLAQVLELCPTLKTYRCLPPNFISMLSGDEAGLLEKVKIYLQEV